MKHLIFTVAIAIICLSINAQITQLSLGTSGSIELFHDSKIDTTDGSSIHVGSRTNPGFGRDLLIVKLTSTQQIAWQKTITNSGEDAFFKVIVCSNGDYVAVGQMFEGGIRRAVAYRISSVGDIIWSYRSTNSALGELFWDVIETTTGNIAIVGADSYETSQTNSFIVLLNSSGTNLWSRVSNTLLADEFRNIIQLPNGNLLVVGFYNPLANYVTTILELTESNASILSQNTYTINASVPGGALNNSLWSTSIFVRNNNVLIQFNAFQGFGSLSNQCIYNYDLATKNLTGNFYYNTAASSAKGYSFYPLTENDFLVAQSYSVPSDIVSVSRVTNGNIAFDRKINNDVDGVYTIDVYNTSMLLSGSVNNVDQDAYNLFSTIDFPTSTAPCSITDQNTIALQSSVVPANASNVIVLNIGQALNSISSTVTDLSLTPTNLCNIIPCTGESIQTRMGDPSATEAFTSNKIDTSDGGTVSVGFINNPASGNGNDLFIVKMNANHQVAWQKTFPNPGDDIFYHVIVCANGDYIAAGHMFSSGIRRAVAMRINRVTGDVIWTYRSANSGFGELFWDVTETANGNIALAGADSYSSGITNSFLVLLNSAGSNIWSRVSTTNLADEFRTIMQLPNGNLLATGFYNPTGFNYHATIVELSENTGVILDQRSYSINTSVPGGMNNNSLFAGRTYMRNDKVLMYFIAFQGFGSASNQCIYSYDLTTKNLTGNILYQPGRGGATGYSFHPLSENDFIVSQSYSTPARHTSASRIIDGTVVADRHINSSVNFINSVDVADSTAAFAGSSNTTLDAYNLFTSLCLPTSTLPCDIADLNTLSLQPSNLAPMNSGAIALSAGPLFSSVTVTPTDINLIIENICGFVIPVTLLDFKGNYNEGSASTLLSWKTANEQNSYMFTIERSNNGGRNFSPIGTKGAHGNSNTLLSYQFTDKYPAQGANLYRLKQTDLDGRNQYSNIVRIYVTRKKDSDYSLYPVPARNVTFLATTSLQTKIIDIAVIDAVGRKIKTQKSSTGLNNPARIDLTGIKPGIYYLQIASSGDKPETIELTIY